MSRNGGQARGAALPMTDCNIIWLPGIERRNDAATQEPREVRSPAASRSQARSLGEPLRALAAAAIVAGQAAALPMLSLGDGGNDPWLTGAAFGMAAAIAAWAGAHMAGKFAPGSRCSPRAAPRDLALHDAFTLALVVAASATLGGIAAALLLPAAAVLSLAIRRMSKRRAAGEQDLMPPAIVAIAVIGLCQPLGFQSLAVAGVALAAAVMVRAGHSCLRAPQGRQPWHIWGMSALMCAAIAFAGQERTGLPSALGTPASIALVAGAIYGFAAGAGARILRRSIAQAVSASVPFLSVAAEIAFGADAHLPQLAAAVLLAAALAGSILYAAPGRKAGGAAAEAWPIGSPRWP